MVVVVVFVAVYAMSPNHDANCSWQLIAVTMTRTILRCVLVRRDQFGGMKKKPFN